MALDKGKLNFLKNELNNTSIKVVWMNLLKTYIKNYSITKNKEDFSNLDEFSEYKVYEEDLLGNLSLVEISLFYEYSLAVFDNDDKKARGAYYTPQDVAEFMALKSLSFDKSKIWLDPCSGVGNLSYHLARVQENPESFVLNNLILQDIDELALKIAHVLFALHFQKNEENFYEKIATNFVHKDFLAGYDKSLYEPSEMLEGFESEEQGSINYDYVIVNPPYLATVKNENFVTFKTRDLYSYFLERIMFESKGFIAITPQSFTNSGNYSTLRNIMIENMPEISIYTFDNMPDSVFKGYKYGSKNTNTANSVRAAITIARKEENNEKINQSHRITPLLRWTAKERAEAFKIDKLDEQLAEINFEKDRLFPKVDKDLANFYSKVKDNETFSKIMGKEETNYSLIVPGTPRYYITAAKTQLDRSSFHKVFFNSEEEQNLAYLLLNSTFMYWWWRANDGGMTISQETLKTLPLLEIKASSGVRFKKLVEDLENSEKINKVTKMNAGKNNENIKHPLSLIQDLDEFLVNDLLTTKALMKTRNNSFLI